MEQRRINDLIAEGAILAVQDGNHGEKHPASADYVEEGIPFLMARDFKGGQIDLVGACKITKKLADSLRIGFAHPGDVLLTHKGSIGLVSIVPNVPDYVMLTPQVTYYRTNPKKLFNNYLKYAFQAPFFRHQLNSFSAQSTRPYVGITAQKELHIDVPPLPVQHRIAGILSAYDELIENNQRRIKILEEMARALYREWFVHFRFPGHDKVKMAPSPLGLIPQGWEVKHLDEVCESVQDGDWIETKDQGGNDYRLLQISNIGVGEFIETGNFRFVTRETFDRLRCTEIKPGDILVARMPTPIGRAWRATEMPWRMITAVDVAIIRTRPEVLSSIFLAQAWNEPFNLQRVAAQASGTTRLRITRRELAALRFIVPPVTLQARFEKLVESKGALATTLRTKNDNLRHTRDLLLPRLLSGQVDLAKGRA